MPTKTMIAWLLSKEGFKINLAKITVGNSRLQ